MYFLIFTEIRLFAISVFLKTLFKYLTKHCTCVLEYCHRASLRLNQLKPLRLHIFCRKRFREQTFLQWIILIGFCTPDQAVLCFGKKQTHSYEWQVIFLEHKQPFASALRNILTIEKKIFSTRAAFVFAQYCFVLVGLVEKDSIGYKESSNPLYLFSPSGTHIQWLTRMTHLACLTFYSLPCEYISIIWSSAQICNWFTDLCESLSSLWTVSH